MCVVCSAIRYFVSWLESSVNVKVVDSIVFFVYGYLNWSLIFKVDVLCYVNLEAGEIFGIFIIA